MQAESHDGLRQDPSVPPDRLRWERLARGDEAVFAEIVREYWPPLVAYATRMAGDGDLAEDLTQEALHRLWDRRKTWKPTATIEALLFRMVRNLALDEKRRITRWGTDATSPDRPGGVTPEHTLDATELDAAISRAIAALPPTRREVFLLVRMTSLTHAAIAELLDLAPQTVSNHMRLALRDLREALAPHVGGTT